MAGKATLVEDGGGASTRPLAVPLDVGPLAVPLDVGAAQRGRSLLQWQVKNACSKKIAMFLLNAGARGTDPKFLDEFKALLGSDLYCGLCIAPCADVVSRYEQILCVTGCMHQGENMCDAKTDLVTIAPFLVSPSLNDRDGLIDMMNLVESDCVYCLLESIDSVCGSGCVRDTLHIFTDYPIIARPCLPELAASLATAQAARMRVHGIHQRSHMLGRGELADAVTQVEDVRRARGGCVRVRLAKAVQHAGHFSLNLRRLGKQHMGVYIALQGLARPAHCAAQLPALQQLLGSIAYAPRPLVAAAQDVPRPPATRCAGDATQALSRL
jgi:hypothetical protein